MMRHRRALSLLALGLALGACSDFAVNRVVTIVVPASVPSIPAGTLVVSLWRYDPLLADASADLAFRAELPFAHREGVETVRRLTVQGDGSGRDRFYLTVDGCDRDADPWQRLLWDGGGFGIPSRVTMQQLEMSYECQLE